MTEAKTYHGSCHCGAVRYDVTTDLGSVIECNCSICSRKGHLLTFVPEAAFDLKAGADATATYHFKEKKITHRHCTTCGVGPYANGQLPDGTKMVAVNVRCLDGVDLHALNVTQVDGRSF